MVITSSVASSSNRTYLHNTMAKPKAMRSVHHWLAVFQNNVSNCTLSPHTLLFMNNIRPKHVPTHVHITRFTKDSRNKQRICCGITKGELRLRPHDTGFFIIELIRCQQHDAITFVTSDKPNLSSANSCKTLALPDENVLKSVLQRKILPKSKTISLLQPVFRFGRSSHRIISFIQKLLMLKKKKKLKSSAIVHIVNVRCIKNGPYTTPFRIALIQLVQMLFK